MLRKLRRRWRRLDSTMLACAAYFVLVVGALAFGWSAVSAHREEQRARVREFHVRSLDCLARNVYYEARGEAPAGQYAVAEVTMNRKASPRYPKTVCDVVYQKEAFSWTEMEVLEPPRGAAWQDAVRVAEDVYYRRQPRALPGVLHFHATHVQPVWSKERQRVARIGRHVFYR